MYFKRCLAKKEMFCHLPQQTYLHDMREYKDFVEFNTSMNTMYWQSYLNFKFYIAAFEIRNFSSLGMVFDRIVVYSRNHQWFLFSCWSHELSLSVILQWLLLSGEVVRGVSRIPANHSDRAPYNNIINCRLSDSCIW